VYICELHNGLPENLYRKHAHTTQITLSTGVAGGDAPRTVLLKDVGTGGDATFLVLTTFADNVTTAFPLDAAAAPFSSVFAPVQVQTFSA
jgi:hypothetical protein